MYTPGIRVAMLFRDQKVAVRRRGIDAGQNRCRALEYLVVQAHANTRQVLGVVDKARLPRGRLKRIVHGPWRETTLYTTLSPCMMCAGTIIQFKIPRVVVADAVNFGGNEGLLRSHGVAVDIIDDPFMIDFFRKWMAGNLDKWHGDIGA
jgi:tRNA(Arg) A34 adenosine deaminase TadA